MNAAGLDPELLREPALVGAEREPGADDRGAALADHRQQVDRGARLGLEQCGRARQAQLDRDRIEVLALDQVAHRVGARARDVRGAEQEVFDAVALDAAHRLLGARRGAGVGGRQGLHQSR